MSWRPPPPPTTWGPVVWQLLHHVEAQNRGSQEGHIKTWDFAMAVTKLLPCSCAGAGVAILRTLPPSAYTVRALHDTVNAKLGKPAFRGHAAQLSGPEATLALAVVVLFLARCRPGPDALVLASLAVQALGPTTHLAVEAFVPAVHAVAAGQNGPTTLAGLGLRPVREHARILAGNPRLHTLFVHASQ